MNRSATADGGSSVSYRPAGSSTGRAAQSSCRARPASRQATSTSVKSRVPAPAQAERARSADFAFSSTFPDGWSCRSRSPLELPRNSDVSECSANPYSFRPPDAAAPNASPSAPAKPRSTPISVRPGGSSQPGPWFPAPLWAGVTRGRASSAGELSAAAFSASATRSRICSLLTPDLATTPALACVPSPVIAITVSLREAEIPLVVSELRAQRRFADEVSSAITTQSSQVAAARARSTASCGCISVIRSSPSAPYPSSALPCGTAAASCACLLRGVNVSDGPGDHRGAAVADRRHLAGLALAAVERAAKDVGLRPADGLHRVPEVGGRGLVGGVAELAGQPAVVDQEEPLAGELEVVPLH